jgi:hypothetical protein
VDPVHIFYHNQYFYPSVFGTVYRVFKFNRFFEILFNVIVNSVISFVFILAYTLAFKIKQKV